MSDFTDDEIRVLKSLTAFLLNAQGGGAQRVADDADLDSDRGDPEVKFSPRRWKGQDYKGHRFSLCDPDFLDAYAEALQYSSEHPKTGREKYARFDAMDAARARGWAKRLRSRPATHAAQPAKSTVTDPADDFANDEIPF